MDLTALGRFTGGAVALCLGVTAPGCLLFGGSAERQEQVDNLRECRDGASDDEALETIFITEEYGDSLHEMVACGNLTVLFATRVLGGIIESVQQGSQGKTPDGWNFEDGVYHTEATGVTMDLELFWEGEAVLDNVFLVDSFLVGASASLQSNGSLSISYESTGPLVELLGFGAEPENPLVLSLSDADEIARSFGKLELETTIVVDDNREKTTVHYEVDSDRKSAEAIVGDGGLTYSLVEADASREDLAQTLTVREWTIEFVDHALLAGYSDFTVEGNHFDYEGRLTFENSTFPERELSCN